MRTVFFGSPPFATPILAGLVSSRHRPVAVVTAPGRPKGRGRKIEESAVAELARAEGIRLLQPKTARDPAFVEELSALEADVFLVASYGELLRDELLALARRVPLNVHPSLLPRHRGATPVPAALLAGDEVTGVAIQRMVRELDAGDLLLVREVAIRPGERAGELLARLAEVSAELVLEALDLVAAQKDTYLPQAEEGVTHCSRLTKADGVLDFTESALALERRVRAMHPWPLARTTLRAGRKTRSLAVHRAALAPGFPGAEPGTVLLADERLVVACGEGALELQEVQLEGKSILAARDFLRGARIEAGSRLGEESPVR